MQVAYDQITLNRLSEAISEAEKRKNPKVEPEHLLGVDLASKTSSLLSLCRSALVDVRQVRWLIQQRLAGLPVESSRAGNNPPKFSKRFTRYIELAEQKVRKAHHASLTLAILLDKILADFSDALARDLHELGLFAFESRAPEPAELCTRQEHAGKSVPKDVLEELCIDLTRLAEEGKIDPVIGRDKEIQEVWIQLNHRGLKNALLLGDPGVGKTAIVEGLALNTVAGKVPGLEGKRILSLDAASLLAGTSYRGELEKRLKTLIEALERNRDGYILFVDEIHNLVGGGEPNIMNLLKPSLARGSIQLIGATTEEEFKRYFEKDEAAIRRLGKIRVNEPSKEDVRRILENLKPIYEEHHQVAYTDNALDAIISLSDHHLCDLRFPDKAIKVLDKSGAQISVSRGLRETTRITVTENDIRGVISMMAGIPLSRLSVEPEQVMARISRTLKNSVVGQNSAIEEIIVQVDSIIRESRVCPKPPSVLLFVGPEGVGKRYCAKLLANELFGNGHRMIQVPTFHLQGEQADVWLTGAKPGFIGHDRGGFLSEKVKRYPHSIVFIDKADTIHPNAKALLAEIMESGEIIDAKGGPTRIDQCIFILAVAADSFPRPKQSIKTAMWPYLGAISEHVKGIIPFQPIGNEHIRRLSDVLLDRLLAGRRNGVHDFRLHLTEVSRQRIADNGWAAGNAVHCLEDYLQRKLVAPLKLTSIGTGKKPRLTVTIDYSEGRGFFAVMASEAKAVPAPQ